MVKSNNKLNKSTKVGIVKLSILLALVIILPLSAIFVTKMNSDASVPIVAGAAKISTLSQNTNDIDLENSISTLDFSVEDVLYQAETLGYMEILSNMGVSASDFLQVAQSVVDLNSNLINTQSQDDFQSRFLWSGTESNGWYSYNDRTGINRLINEVIIWSALGVTAAIIAACAALVVAMNNAISWWAVIKSFKEIILPVLAFCFGNCASAIVALGTCYDKVDNMQNYGYSRTYFLGVTTGYSAW